MIASLKGTLIAKQPTSIIVDVQGVGYEVRIPVSTYYELGEVGSAVSLFVYTHVREDAIQLYGFRTQREKELFMQLIGVGGVGPKLAITILSGLSADDLIMAIRTNALAKISSIPGIGKKTAERLVVELRDKLAPLSSEEAEAAYVQASAAEEADEAVKRDVISALMNLGYARSVAERAVTSTMAAESDHSMEWILKQSLKRLFR
ncbi:MAG: Holliday junction branch migration protein RuvA [Acidobacteria bacterium]|nr:MAG: Holliday junction branch migration protein RuvA [Acidobacteriota bacterium]